MKSRYFTFHTGKFVECRAVRLDDRECAFVKNDLTERLTSMYCLADALALVDKGTWIEVTEDYVKGRLVDLPADSGAAGAW